MSSHFTALDLLVLVAYLAGVTLLGLWMGGRQEGTRDYFVGRQQLPWWAILLSVVATETSAITFISIPGVAYAGNFTFLQVATGYLLGRAVIAFVLLPRYFDGELVTAYTLLQTRFGPRARRFASVTFMFTRVLADSVRVFATAIPLALIIGPALPAESGGRVAILAIGALTLLYTWKGGMRAVVWTDVLQASIYIAGGVIALVLLGRAVPGGWEAILGNAASEGKLRVFDLYMGFDRPYTLFAGLLGGAFLSMASHGADQLIVQRLLAANGLANARRALIGSGVAVIAQFALFLLVGIGLYSYYGTRAFTGSDQVFPTFVLEAMPPGLTGLIVAAILAAAMSTISSSLNSLAAAATHDVYAPLFGAGKSESELLRVGRAFTAFWGVVVIGAALLFRTQGTPVVVVALSIASFTYGGLLGAFFLAIFSKRARERDALVGMTAGVALMTVVVFARQIAAAVPATAGVLSPLAAIAWPWYVLIGTCVTMFAAAVSARLGASRAALSE